MELAIPDQDSMKALVPMEPVPNPPMASFYADQAGRRGLKRIKGFSLVSGIWLLSTFFLMIGHTISLGFPYWISQTSNVIAPNPARLGAVNMEFTANDILQYNSYLSIENTNLATKEIPEAMKATAVLYSIGCALLFVSGIFIIIGMLIPKIKALNNFSIFAISYVLQTLAIVVFLVGLIVFPVSFGHPFVTQFCATSYTFNIGTCNIDWAFILSIVFTAATSFLPPLAVFSMNVVDDLPFICAKPHF